MSYIEKEKVIDIMNAKADMALGTPKEVFLSVAKMVETLPAADVVTVVRCGECKRWKADGGYGLDLDGTKRLYGKCAITNMSIKENCFCNFGAKKNAEEGK